MVEFKLIIIRDINDGRFYIEKFDKDGGGFERQPYTNPLDLTRTYGYIREEKRLEKLIPISVAVYRNFPDKEKHELMSVVNFHNYLARHDRRAIYDARKLVSESVLAGFAEQFEQFGGRRGGRRPYSRARIP